MIHDVRDGRRLFPRGLARRSRLTPYQFVLALVLLRCVESALVFRLVCFPLSGWPTTATPLAILGGTLVLAPVAEGLIAALCLAGVRTLRRSPAAAVAAFGTGFLLTVFLLVEGTSWWLRAAGQGFVHWSMLTSAVSGFATLAPWFGARELTTVAALVAFNAAISALLLWAAPPISGRQAGALAAIAAAATVLLFVVTSLPRRLLDTSTASLAGAIVKADLLPSVTLVWSHVLFPDSTPPAPVTPLLPRTATPYAQSSPSAPNIIIFEIESLRAGEEIRAVDGIPVMPVVSRMASEGRRFVQAYAPSNESATSVAALLTSRDPLKYAVRETNWWRHAPTERIYDVLSPAYTLGYFSSSNENWQDMRSISWSPALDRFFDAASSPGEAVIASEADTGFRDAVRNGTLKTGSLDDVVTTAAFHAWIEEWSRRPSRKPFLAFVGYQTSHYPYQQGFHVPLRFTPADLSPADLRECTFYSYPARLAGRMRNRYWNSLAHIDSLIGQTAEFLRARGLLENTVFLILGDHGEMFGENGAVTHASKISNAVLHVPLVVWGKGIAPNVCSAPASLLDVAPIAGELAQTRPFPGFQGEVPRCDGEDDSRPIFSTAQHTVFEDSVLVRRWRYTRQQDGLYAHLYDVAADPLEMHDLSETEPAILDCLRTTLDIFRRDQLGYYARPELAARYFPPQHRLAGIPACQVVERR